MKHFGAALLFMVLCCLAPAQGFKIPHFKADLTLDKDGTLHVIETIEVIFTEEHHGIFRDIPIAYDTGKGVSRTLVFTGISVSDASGNGLPTLVSRKGENLDIRIGDKDSFAPVGVPLTYVIHYDCFGQMNWFDDSTEFEPHSELYWNLTGSEWQEAMDKVDFTVHYPHVQSGKGVIARLFPGSYGSRRYQQVAGIALKSTDNELGTYLESDADTLSGGLTRPMMPGEELTFVVQLPTGTVAKPTIGQQLKMFLIPNLGFTIPIVVSVILFLMWARYGKDPARKPIAVQFEPPDDLSGAEAGTLIDERVDQRDLAAGIIGLAVKGYLTITPIDTGSVFKSRTATISLTGAQGKPLSSFEQLLLTKLQNCTQPIDTMELRTHVAPHLPQLKRSLYDSLVDRAYYLANPDSVRNGWLGGGIVVNLALGFICFLLSPTREVLPSVVGGVMGVVIVALFSQIMPRRTSAGADAQEKVAGFAEFIKRARGKEFDWMSKKEPTASLFEEYLPHAIAFGLAAEWAAAFEGILHEMPSWYGAPYGTPFYPGYFASDMVAVSDSLGAAAMTPPRSDGASGGSSGFGGGGFSGGGFGGGGGGSW